MEAKKKISLQISRFMMSHGCKIRHCASAKIAFDMTSESEKSEAKFAFSRLCKSTIRRFKAGLK